MRILAVTLVPLLALAACGNEEQIANKKSELTKIESQLAALERELTERLSEWKPVKDAFAEASQALKRALLSGSRSAGDEAQAAYTLAQKKNQGVSQLEWDLRGRIGALKDKQQELQDAIKALGGS